MKKLVLFTLSLVIGLLVGIGPQNAFAKLHQVMPVCLDPHQPCDRSPESGHSLSNDDDGKETRPNPPWDDDGACYRCTAAGGNCRTGFPTGGQECEAGYPTCKIHNPCQQA